MANYMDFHIFGLLMVKNVYPPLHLLPYENDEISPEYNGTYKQWTSNGQLWIQCNYVNGKFPLISDLYPKRYSWSSFVTRANYSQSR